jgi:quercetin dioxygenase-like cupin family protein
MSDDGWERVDDLVRRKVTNGANLTVSRYVFEPGGVFPLHAHEQEQVTIVLRGKVTMTVEEERHTLEAGDSLVIGPNVPHRGEVGAQGAEVIGVVAPPRAGSGDMRFLEESGGA